MSGSMMGTILKISTWGESHGSGLGVVVDGCPAGIELSPEDIQHYLDLRKPGTSAYSTPRREDDRVQILSGVFEGRTTGTPISMLVFNKSQRSSDYSEIADLYRPGHADYGYDSKYGIRDYRGGGRSSGRETIGRVAAGAVAMKILSVCGIRVLAYVRSVGSVSIDPDRFDEEEIWRNPLYMPDPQAAQKAASLIERMKEAGDSVGGVIECRITGVPAGLGDPVFDKLSARLAGAICSIGAVRGFEIGDGFAAAGLTGSENNDPFLPPEKEGKKGTLQARKASNHAGGILGGISDGSPIIFRAAFKPTPSISIPQTTIRTDGSPASICVRGRHDPVIMPRAVVVVQSMAALTLADSLLMNMTSRIEYVRNFYSRT